MNSGRLPDTSGWPAIIGCSASTARARSERSCGLASSAFRLAVMLSMLREGGAVLRRAGRVESAAGVPVANWDCGASPKPLASASERLVSGVPAPVSAGAAGGLPDLPREGRGLGVVSETRCLDVSRGGRDMRPVYGAAGALSQPAKRCPQNATIGALNRH